MRFENVIQILQEEIARLIDKEPHLFTDDELREFDKQVDELDNAINLLKGLNRNYDYAIDILKKEEQYIEEKYKDDISGDIAYSLYEIDKAIDILEEGLRCLKLQ